MNKKINKEIRPQAHRYLDASPQPEELLAIALGQGRDRVLAGRIHVDIRRHAFHGVHGLVPQDAVDEHHMAIELALPHRADGSLSAEHDAHYVGLQDQLHLGRIHVHQVARLQGPSIVHQYVDGAQLLDDPVEGLVHRALAAHVAVEGKELALFSAGSSFCSSFTRSTRRARPTTVMPALTRSLAMAEPMPELAPVTTATRFCQRSMLTAWIFTDF